MEIELNPILGYGIGGLAFLCASISVMVRRFKLIKTGMKVDATVVRTELQETVDSEKTWYSYVAILKYTFANEEYEEPDTGHVKPKFADGETVVIYVDADNPKKFHVKGDKIQLFGSIFFMIIGLVLVFYAISLWLK